MTALKVVTALKARYDAQQLRQQIEEIERMINLLGRQIEEVLAIDVKAAFRHLEAASLATNDEFRRTELMLARSSFTRMTERPTDSLTHPGRKQLSAQQVAAIGHAGNYSYCLLNNEPRLALLEAYRCTERFPALGVQLFPVEIFSRDYRAAGYAVAKRQADREFFQDLHQSEVAYGKKDRAEYLREAWRVPAAGAVLLGGLIGGAVAPPLAGRGVMGALGILNGTGNRSLRDLPQLSRPKADPRAHAFDPQEEVELMRQASAEGARGRQALERSA